MTKEERAWFDEVIDRSGTNSVKWNVAEGELPMWVADMDFRAAPCIQEAIIKRAEHGVFGYSVISDEWREAVTSWWERRHNVKFSNDEVIFTTGVVPILSSAVRKFTTPAENVVVQSPVYNMFFNSIVNNGRNVLNSPLVYENGEYHMDLDDLEKKLADPQTSLMILCNPHNPVGKIWDRETLAKIGELAAKNGVIVISDEIHCDITDPGCEYIPFASVSETCRYNSITCVAPTKTFNLAGLHTAAAIVPNPILRHKLERALNTDEVAEPNAFSIQAAVAAFNGGEQWLDALREYIYENKQLVARFLAERLPELHLTPSEATYLLWLDCSKVCDNSKEFADTLRAKTGLFVADGAKYGSGGEKFLRVNIACPKARVEDGLRRLEKGIR